MVDLDVGKRRVELYIDVALPGRKLERRHGGGEVGFGRGGRPQVTIATECCVQCSAVRYMSTYEQEADRRVTGMEAGYKAAHVDAVRHCWLLAVGCWPGGERLVSWSLREAAELTSPTLQAAAQVHMGLGVGQRAAARRVPARALRHAQFTVGVHCTQ